MRQQRGFTIAELVVTIVIGGVLAMVVLPRFDIDPFSSRGARDFVGSALRHAQKSAMAMRRNVCVAIVADRLDLTYAATAGNTQTCVAGNTIVNPGNGKLYNDNTNALPQAGWITSPPSTVMFDALGRPMTAAGVAANAAITVMVSGNATPITIEPGTGVVH